MIKEGDAKVSVNAEKGLGGMTLDVTIRGEVRAECDRCLELLSLPVDYSGRLEVRVGEGEYDGDVMWLGQGEDVDLRQYLYESICLDLPLSIVHGEDADGRSLCNPDMLQRFGIVSPEEFERMEVAAEKGKKSKNLEALEGLKEEMEKDNL